MPSPWPRAPWPATPAPCPAWASDLDGFAPATWDELRADGSLTTRRITGAEAADLLAGVGAVPTVAAAPDATFVELFVGLASAARIGRNLLGGRRFAEIAGRSRPGDLLLFVGGRGLYSFRARPGGATATFDRIQLVQDDRTWRLAAEDHVRVDELAVAGAPELREASLFVMPRRQRLSRRPAVAPAAADPRPHAGRRRGHDRRGDPLLPSRRAT